MDYLKIKSEIEAKTCPIHNIRPLVKLESGNIALRCCCDMFTSRCMAEIDKMERDTSLFNIVDAWEADLFSNKMQLV